MTGADTCEIIGQWRIVGVDLWDRDYLDLVEPACLEIGKDDGPSLPSARVAGSLGLAARRLPDHAECNH